MSLDTEFMLQQLRNNGISTDVSPPFSPLTGVAVSPLARSTSFSARTPGFNPVEELPAAPPLERSGSLFASAREPSAMQKFLNNPMLLNILAQQGHSLTPGPSPLGVIGRAGLATVQHQTDQRRAKIEDELLKARTGLAQRQTEAVGQQSAARVQSSKRLSNGNIGLVMSDGNVVDSGVKEAGRSQLINVPGMGLIRHDPTNNTITQVGSEEIIQSGTRDRATAQNEGSNAREDRRAFQANIALYDQQIARAKGFIEALDDGRLDTGPLIDGATSSLTPVGQDFRSFANERVVDLIGSATFGALSEGEREFLSQISFSLQKDESINRKDLVRFVEILEKAKEIEQGELNNLRGDSSGRFDGFSIEK